LIAVEDRTASESALDSEIEVEVEEEVVEKWDEDVSEEDVPLSVGKSCWVVFSGKCIVVKACEIAVTVGVVGESNCEKGVMVPSKEASRGIGGDSLELKRRAEIGGMSSRGSSVPSASTPKMSRTSIELMLSLW